MKEFHPAQTAEIDDVQRIDHESAFNSCVKHLLKKRYRMIASIRKQQTRYLIKSHKFGIELPKTVDEALPQMPRLAIPYGWMQYPKKWRMSEWHSKFYQMGRTHT